MPRKHLNDQKFHVKKKKKKKPKNTPKRFLKSHHTH